MGCVLDHTKQAVGCGVDIKEGSLGHLHIRLPSNQVLPARCSPLLFSAGEKPPSPRSLSGGHGGQARAWFSGAGQPLFSTWPLQADLPLSLGLPGLCPPGQALGGQEDPPPRSGRRFPFHAWKSVILHSRSVFASYSLPLWPLKFHTPNMRGQALGSHQHHVASEPVRMPRLGRRSKGCAVPGQSPRDPRAEETAPPPPGTQTGIPVGTEDVWSQRAREEKQGVPFSA